MLLGKLLYYIMLVMWFNRLLSNGTLSRAWGQLQELWGTLWTTLQDLFSGATG